MTTPIKILNYGYGNSGRQDDGPGNEFIKRMEEWVRSEGLTEVARLNLEKALTFIQEKLRQKEYWSNLNLALSLTVGWKHPTASYD